jgi:hypothetical protein
VEVLGVMWPNRIKALGAGLAALLLALVGRPVLGAPLRGEGPARAEKPGEAPKKPDEKPEKPAPKVFLFGTVKEVSADGKTVTVAPGPFVKDGKDQSFKIGDKTMVRFSSVGLSEDQVRKGQSVFAILPGKGAEVAERAQFTGLAAAKAQQPTVAGVVSAVGEDGKSLTISPRAPGKDEKPKDVTVKLTPRTTQLFFNVGPGEAKPTRGMNVFATLARRAKDTATALTWNGAGKLPLMKTRFTYVGMVVAVGADGKSITVEPFRKAKEDKPARAELKLGPASRQVFSRVGAGGARPQVGYSVTVWVDEKEKDTVGVVYYAGNPPAAQDRVFGRVTGVSADGKSFTLAVPPVGKGEKGKGLTVKLAGDAVLVFGNVPPGGARIKEGYQANVQLEDGSKDTAEVVYFYVQELAPPKPGPGPSPGPGAR